MNRRSNCTKNRVLLITIISVCCLQTRKKQNHLDTTFVREHFITKFRMKHFLTWSEVKISLNTEDIVGAIYEKCEELTALFDQIKSFQNCLES